MKTPTATCEIFVCIDSEGQYAVGTDADLARQAYEEDVGCLNEQDGFRLVKVTLTVPLPKAVELTGTVPSDDTDATLDVA